MTIRERVPVFGAFVRAYLHEDFVAEHGTPEAALQAFVREAAPDDRRALAAELEVLTAHIERLSLPALRTFLVDELGAGWWPARKRDVVRLLRVGGRRARSAS